MARARKSEEEDRFLRIGLLAEPALEAFAGICSPRLKTYDTVNAFAPVCCRVLARTRDKQASS
jgi:hypothetical protein